MFKRTLLLSALLLAGCVDASEPLNVHILPSEYRVGTVRSALATPVVDEVVRLKPQKVHLSTCLATPPAKVLQFNVELGARLDTQVTGGFFETCPEI